MEDHEIRAGLEENRRNFREIAANLRRDIFDHRKALENPHLTPNEREALEGLVFEQMEMLRETEDSIEDCSETIANLGKAQDAHSESVMGMVVGVAVFIVVFVLILA